MKKIINFSPWIKNKKLCEWIEALVFALIVALIFRTWIYAPFKVPTGSMIPTIQRGDQLFADMHSYGWALPFTEIKFFKSPVKRGDIIIFPYPEDPSIDFIKRAIAIGGDVLEIKGESVYINGKPENTPQAYFDPEVYPVLKDIQLTVPKGKIWAMGDNRRNSKDSRFWGYVEENSVKGQAKIFYWSHDPDSSIFNGYRWERIGKFLE